MSPNLGECLRKQAHLAPALNSWGMWNADLQTIGIFLGILIWMQRRENEGVPKIYLSPDPPPSFLVRMIKGERPELKSHDEEEKASAPKGAT